MKIKSISSKDAVKLIQAGKLFLPPIQRDFVWRYDRIMKLFDSLYRNYPINNFIFWKLEPRTAQQYPLHHFTTSYAEKVQSKTQSAPRHLFENDVWAVVDGQQRLSSLFIGLAGVYKYKNGKGRNVESNLISSRLHFNLFENTRPDGDEAYFEFLSEEDAKFVNDKQLWFELGKVLQWGDLEKQLEKQIEELFLRVKNCGRKTALRRFNEQKVGVTEKLTRLFDMVNKPTINYLEIAEQNIDEVVEMFTRINAGGMVLKKSDLLFSTLVSVWPEGKEEIDNMAASLYESGIPTSKDFVMRACIVLTDLPVKYRIESFNKKNVGKIKSDWCNIKDALNKLIDLLPAIGYNYQKGLSEYALIPIAYYLMKGGSINQRSKSQLQLYYSISQINSVFGGQGDQVLEKIRAAIKDQLATSNFFDFHSLKELRLPGGKSLTLSRPELENLIQTVSYWSPHAYFLLSMIYPNIDFKVHRYQVDHIHPRSKFSKNNLLNNGVQNVETIDYWIDEKRDLLPNLQLLAGIDNNSKKSKTIIDYLKGKPVNDRKHFIQDNLLPSLNNKELLELRNFDDFFEWRSEQLFRKLRSALKI